MPIRRSEPLRKMLDRVKELRRHMLPRMFSPVGAYALRWHDRAAGYRLLVHAEIQSCVESMARDALLRCISAAESNKIGLSTEWLFACYEDTDGFERRRLNQDTLRSVQHRHIPDLANLGGVVKERANKFRTKVINRNNGIRKPNLLQLLLPVGVSLSTIQSALDGSWLQKIDEFGEERGKTAHRSGAINQLVDPRTEYEVVQEIVRGLHLVDSELLSIRYHSPGSSQTSVPQSSP